MQTDIPLKRLTVLRGADLLPLLGPPATTLLGVEALELPASATRLDTVLRVRSPHGQEYLHVVEWQGYRDPAVLWRLASYMAWLGQRTPEQTILGTLIYLAPAYDMGATLTQRVDGQVVQTWPMACVRLWEQDAGAAVATGNLGLAVLSPLMRNADPDLVGQAITLLLQQAPAPQQADLLAILGVFAAPLINPARFIRMIGKEKLMSSDLLSTLVEEKLAELRPQLEARLAAERWEFQQTLADVISKRFPHAPLTLMDTIRRITHPAQLRTLIMTAVTATDLSEVERVLQQAAAAAPEGAANAAANG
ncbi:MAG: hypothetical protein MI924_38425 [Chloroflexales bacterium]|nr:hypothetical protein [Chloroflexales bacterium]